MSLRNIKPNDRKTDPSVYESIPCGFVPIVGDNDNNVYCNLCNRVIKNDIGKIKNHLARHEMDEPIERHRPAGYQCHSCGTGTTTADYFRVHILTDSHRQKCGEAPHYSFRGRTDNVMIYATADVIKKRMRSEGVRHCGSVPVMSEFMKTVLDDFEKPRPRTGFGVRGRKWYACMPCNRYSTQRVHSPRGCYNCSTQYYCRHCNIQIFCAEHVYRNHLHSYEHNLLASKVRDLQTENPNANVMSGDGAEAATAARPLCGCSRRASPSLTEFMADVYKQQKWNQNRKTTSLYDASSSSSYTSAGVAEPRKQPKHDVVWDFRHLATVLHDKNHSPSRSTDGDSDDCSWMTTDSDINPLSEDDDYVSYVSQQLKQIKDESIKSKVKMAIDDVFDKFGEKSDL